MCVHTLPRIAYFIHVCIYSAVLVPSHYVLIYNVHIHFDTLLYSSTKVITFFTDSFPHSLLSFSPHPSSHPLPSSLTPSFPSLPTPPLTLSRPPSLPSSPPLPLTSPPQAPSPKFKYRFMATLQYDFATHHRRDRLQCRLELVGDFELHIRVLDAEGDILVKKAFDLSRENCRITISPQDVFENRKRRWSKKYPIRLEIGSFEIFLFANVSRFKQEWFFRLREAVQGTKTEELIKKQKEFYRYMQRYFPPEPLRHTSLHTASMSSHRSATASTSATQRTARQHAQRKHRAHVDVGAVQFSSTSTIEEEDEASGGSISISQSQGPGSRHYQREHSVASSTLSAGTSVSEHTGRPLPTHSLSTTSGTVGTSFSSFPEPPLLGSSNWINALTARLYWDVWHETRWKDWIVSRIQRKLVRIKTPRFLDPLQLTDIAIGDSMPVINRLYEGPFLRPDGVWVYLDVTYEGLFVMTIKTKLKLGQGKGEEEEKGRELKSVKHL